MVSKAFVNVGRWSALAFGLVYGYTHNVSLNKQAEVKQKEAAYHHKEKLIEQAKLAYAKQQLEKSSVKAPEAELDFESPDFDFDNYISQLDKQ